MRQVLRRQSAPRPESDPLDWKHIDAWPNNEVSRQIKGPVHLWHVQETGAGDTVLLLHGAGGSTHSFRDLIPLLAQRFHVVAIDLPGQGFTRLGARNRCGLDQMVGDIQALCEQEGWHPRVFVGHSAGAAICLRLAKAALHKGTQGVRVIGLNAALGRFTGIAGMLFPAMAKALAATPFVTALFAGTARNPERARALLDSTGSKLSPEGLEFYRRLIGNRDHVNGALLMMAQWSLDDLLDELPDFAIPTLLIVGEKDQTVPPKVSREAAQILPNAHIKTLADLGHLAHEERPAEIAGLIQSFAEVDTPRRDQFVGPSDTR
ncbi:MAG: alpha/beta fold hydrolase BchO [Pseudomonadota bacterium]